MKVIGGIPTKSRDTAPKVAAGLAPLCEEVMIVSSDTPMFTGMPDNVHQMEIPAAEVNILKSFHTVYEWMLSREFDVAIVCDDDVGLKTDKVKLMLDVMERNPTLGICRSWTDIESHWKRNQNNTQPEKYPFVAVPYPAQLFAIRRACLEELKGIRIPILLDVEFGIRAWSLGWAVVHAHGAWHVQLQPSKRGDKKGGLAYEEIVAKHEACVKYLTEHYPQFGTYKLQMRNHVVIGNYESHEVQMRYTARYKYAAMAEQAVKRFGEIGYKDLRGFLL